MDWDVATEVAIASRTDRRATSRVIQLIDSGNTLPFIARYRKEATGNMDPDSIRLIKYKLAACREVIERVDKAFKSLSTKEALTVDIRKNLKQCKSIEDVMIIVEPFKEAGPKTLAAKAKAQGLEPIANSIMRHRMHYMFHQAVPGMSAQDVRTGVLHIIADIFAKDLNIYRLVEELSYKYPPLLTTSCASTKKANVSTSRHGSSQNISDSQSDLNKFAAYLQFSEPLHKIAPHKILAINRAEERKVIRVKLKVSESVVSNVRNYIADNYLSSVHSQHYDLFWDAFEDAWKRLLLPCITKKLRSRVTQNAHEISLGVFSDNLKRLLMTAPLRNTPLPNAGDIQNDRIADIPDVVSASLGSPGDRVPVIGLDPGWRHGTKWAACDPLGSVLESGVIHVTLQNKNVNFRTDTGVKRLADCMRAHGITTISLGNGQACRQTEKWLADAVAQGIFLPLKVRYTIVSEAGASVYSASPLASQEHPDLDVSVRGAVSIAHRLQDPLAEMVKIEPKHLGIGMYQHDLPRKRLEGAVNELMEECISFVGVDVNTAQQHVLAKVAGLSVAKAKEIIQYRSTNGRFRCRNELLKVKGIGLSTFAQCAGFLRVKPVFCSIRMNSKADIDFVSLCTDSSEKGSGDIEMKVVSRKRQNRLVTKAPAPAKQKITMKPSTYNDLTFNPLDQTAIHPNSYHIATALVKHLNHEISDVGCMPLRNKAKALFASQNRDAVLSLFEVEEFGVETLRDILDALCRPLDFDERENQFAPMFRSSVISITNLRQGLQITGRVENVTTFGAFVDIGVEESAFIPVCNFPRPLSKSFYSNSAGPSAYNTSKGVSTVHQMSLHLGDRVKARVERVCLKTRRIGLTDVEILKI